jgi:hypothetical protein
MEFRAADELIHRIKNAIMVLNGTPVLKTRSSTQTDHY